MTDNPLDKALKTYFMIHPEQEFSGPLDIIKYGLKCLSPRLPKAAFKAKADCMDIILNHLNNKPQSAGEAKASVTTRPQRERGD